jgi:hypothetical protein
MLALSKITGTVSEQVPFAPRRPPGGQKVQEFLMFLMDGAVCLEPASAIVFPDQ